MESRLLIVQPKLHTCHQLAEIVEEARYTLHPAHAPFWYNQPLQIETAITPTDALGKIQALDPHVIIVEDQLLLQPESGNLRQRLWHASTTRFWRKAILLTTNFWHQFDPAWRYDFVLRRPFLRSDLLDALEFLLSSASFPTHSSFL